MFPLNDLSLKTQPVQLNKVTSNTESTIKQHELVSDDAIINELSSELVSCLGNGSLHQLVKTANYLICCQNLSYCTQNISNGVIIVSGFKVSRFMIRQVLS